MATGRSRKSRLTVATAGKVHYIEAPSDRATALHEYLRRHGVRAAPPEPCASGLDTIELIPGADLAAVQGLLNRWA